MRTVGVRLTADVSQYMSSMKRAGLATTELTGSLDKAAKAGKLDKVADQALRFGLVGAAGFGYVVKAAADFDKQMSAVSAATHANATDMNALREAALKAGKDTQFSATQAADGITQLSKAGVSTANILGGGLKGALDLAAAGQMSVGDAAEVASSAMTQFKLTGAQIPHVADLLAAGAGKAQGDVHDLSMALSQGGLVAAQMGLSIEDTTGTLAAFASAGLMGSDAGTSMKNMFLQLANPSKKAADTMKDLGISAYNAQGQFIGVTGLAGQLRDRLSGLTQEQRNAALATIFGSDAIRAASILYNNGAKGIQDWINKTNDAGYAADTAARLTDNLAGDVERLKGSIETLAIESGSGANGGLRVLTKGLNGLVDEFASMPSAVGSTVTVLTGVVGVAGLALAGFIKLRKGVAAATLELNAMGPAGERAAVGLQAASKWAGRIGLAFVALEVIGTVADHFGNAAVNVDRLTAALQDYATTGKLTQGITDEFGTNLKDFNLIARSAQAATHGFWGGLNDLTSAIPGVSSVVDTMNEKLTGTSFNDATQKMKGLDQALSAFIATQKDGKRASEIWNQLLVKSGLDTEQLAALLPNAWSGLQKLQVASHDAAGGQASMHVATAKATGAIKSEADKADEAVKSIKALSDALHAQVDPAFALIAAQKALKDAQKAAADATAKHGRNSEQARKATRDLASAALDMQKQASTLAAGLAGHLTPQLYATLKAAGLNERQIRDVSKQFDSARNAGEKFAKRYNATVDITHEETVGHKLGQLSLMQQYLKKGGTPPAPLRRAFAFDQGGWTGPGGKYQPAGIVHADEFVIRKESRQSIEQQRPGALDHMNRTGRLPGYAAGGAVAWPFPVTAAMTRIPSQAEASAAVMPSFGNWPSSPSAQRYDSGVWRSVVALIRSTGPISGHFGNAYRPGDPLWHGSGRAVDWMGYNQDALASFLAARRPLELIHRTKRRDYAYTRGVNKGSFNNALMEAHRNHVHIAMANGGVIGEPVVGVGASGATYSFAEQGPETVIPGTAAAAGGRTTVVNVNVDVAAGANPREAGRQIIEQIRPFLEGGGSLYVRGQRKL